MKSFALYLRPRGNEQARRVPDLEPCHSARSARALRGRLRREGVDALIHVGEDHPDPLPFGATLWQYPGRPLPEPEGENQ
jgi:hypothetical protein